MRTQKAALPAHLIFLLLNIVVLPLAGCAQYRWVHATKNTQQYSEDQYSCTVEASKAYPPSFQRTTLSHGYTKTEPIRCDSYHKNRKTGCSKTTYVAPVTKPIDANSTQRKTLIKYCMQAKGWRLEKIEQ